MLTPVLPFDHLVDCLAVTFDAASGVAALSPAVVQAVAVSAAVEVVLMKSVGFVFVVAV